MPSKKDYTGFKIDGLEVLSAAENQGRYCMWWVKCYCGKLFKAKGYRIATRHTQSCGCKKLDSSYAKANQFTVKDYTGFKHNGLEVLYIDDSVTVGNRKWIIKCHCGELFSGLPSMIIAGKRKGCRSCGRKSTAAAGKLRTGEKSGMYNPNLTTEDRMKWSRKGLAEVRVWRAQVFERDNYTCQICNCHGGRLNAHHLNGWHWAIDERYDLDNGVTLCKACHNNFHSVYSSKNNTKEQYQEYSELMKGLQYAAA